MSRIDHLNPVFVDFIPEVLDEGKIYVSMKYRTAAHLCCCGCDEKVVTPIAPHDWQIAYDGIDISVTPSIGNWSFACQSHYWITDGMVNWSYKFTSDEIRRARTHDRAKAQIAAGELRPVPEAEVKSDASKQQAWWKFWLR